MNNYNIVADYIAQKYIDRISGSDLDERILGEEQIDLVMTGLLAEDRIEQSFEGRYIENQDTKFQSIPSIGLKFDVTGEDSVVTIYPKGLLFYTVKPNYGEVIEYYIRVKSNKEQKKYTGIEQLAEEFPEEKFVFPKVYKHINLREVFKDGLKVNLDEVSN